MQFFPSRPFRRPAPSRRPAFRSPRRHLRVRAFFLPVAVAVPLVSLPGPWSASLGSPSPRFVPVPAGAGSSVAGPASGCPQAAAAGAADAAERTWRLPWFVAGTAFPAVAPLVTLVWPVDPSPLYAEPFAPAARPCYADAYVDLASDRIWKAAWSGTAVHVFFWVAFFLLAVVRD